MLKIPDSIIETACDLAYREDCNQVIGQDEHGAWIVRCAEDPASTPGNDIKRYAIECTAAGIDPALIDSGAVTENWEIVDPDDPEW